MKIEQKYYTKEAELWARAEKEASRHADYLLEDIEEIYRLAEEQQNGLKIIRQERLDKFQELVEKALVFAEIAPMDICVDTRNYFGSIRMTADCVLTVPGTSAKMRGILSELIAEVDDFDFETKDGLVEINLVYRFIDECK